MNRDSLADPSKLGTGNVPISLQKYGCQHRLKVGNGSFILLVKSRKQIWHSIASWSTSSFFFLITTSFTASGDEEDTLFCFLLF